MDQSVPLLSPQQLRQYEEQGYLIVPDVVSPEIISIMKKRTSELIEASREVGSSNDTYDLEDGHSSSNPRLTRVKEPHRVDPAVFYNPVLGADCMLPRILRDLLGDAVAIQTSKLNIKSCGGGQAVEWHQDWAFYPATNASLLAVGLMVDDVSEDNAPLHVIPGSHKGPLLSHHNQAGTHFCGAVSPSDPDFHKDRAVCLTGKAGSVTIHHVRLLHGSAPNRSDRNRIMCFYEVAAADAWPLAGGASYIHSLSQAALWADMVDRMIFGQPCMTPRLENNPVRLCLPPAPRGGSIFKTQKSGGAVSAFQ